MKWVYQEKKYGPSLKGFRLVERITVRAFQIIWVAGWGFQYAYSGIHPLASRVGERIQVAGGHVASDDFHTSWLQSMGVIHRGKEDAQGH